MSGSNKESHEIEVDSFSIYVKGTNLENLLLSSLGLLSDESTFKKHSFKQQQQHIKSKTKILQVIMSEALT